MFRIEGVMSFPPFPRPTHCHPEQSEGSKIPFVENVLLPKEFRFLTAFGMTGEGVWSEARE